VAGSSPIVLRPRDVVPPGNQETRQGRRALKDFVLLRENGHPKKSRTYGTIRNVRRLVRQPA
jgi:hypothetical protein